MSDISGKMGESKAESDDSSDWEHNEVAEKLRKLIAMSEEPEKKKSIFIHEVQPGKIRQSIVHRALKKSVICSTPFNKNTGKFFCSDSSCSPIITSKNDSLNKKNTENYILISDSNSQLDVIEASPENKSISIKNEIETSNKEIVNKESGISTSISTNNENYSKKLRNKSEKLNNQSIQTVRKNSLGDGNQLQKLTNKSLNQLNDENVQNSGKSIQAKQNLPRKSPRNQQLNNITSDHEENLATNRSRNLKSTSSRNQLTFNKDDECIENLTISVKKKGYRLRNKSPKDIEDIQNSKNLTLNNDINCNKSIPDKQIIITKTPSKIPVFNAAKQKQIEQTENNTSKIISNSISNQKSPKRRLTSCSLRNSSSTEPEIKKIRLDNLIESLKSKQSKTPQNVQHREVQTSYRKPISAIKTLARKPIFNKSDRESASSSISSTLIQDIENASVNIYDSVEEGNPVERFSSLYDYNNLENSTNLPWRYEFSNKIITTSRNSGFLNRRSLFDKQFKRNSIKQYHKSKIATDYSDTSTENVFENKSTHSSVDLESSKNENENNIEKWLTDVNRINQPENSTSQNESDINNDYITKKRYFLRIVVEDISRKKHNIDNENTVDKSIDGENEIPVQNTENDEEIIRRTNKSTKGKGRPLSRKKDIAAIKDVDDESKKLTKSPVKNDQSNPLDTDEEGIFRKPKRRARPLSKKMENTVINDVDESSKKLTKSPIKNDQSNPLATDEEEIFRKQKNRARPLSKKMENTGNKELNKTLVQDERSNALITDNKINKKTEMTTREKPRPLSKKKPKNTEIIDDSNQEEIENVTNNPKVPIKARFSKKISNIENVECDSNETIKNSEENKSIQTEDICNQLEETIKRGRFSKKNNIIENLEDSNETIKNSNEEINPLQVEVLTRTKEKSNKGKAKKNINKGKAKKTSNIEKSSLQETTNRKKASKTTNNLEITKNDGASMVTNSRPTRERKPPPKSIFSCIVIADQRIINSISETKKTSKTIKKQKTNISTIHEDPHSNDIRKTINKSKKVENKMLVNEETIENSCGFPPSNELVNSEMQSNLVTELPENEYTHKSDLDSGTSTLKSPTDNFNSRTTRKNKTKKSLKRLNKNTRNNNNDDDDEYIEVPINNSANKRLKYVENNISYTECDDKLKYSNTLDHPSGVSMLYLKVPPRGVKTPHISKKHDLFFYVIQGNGRVTIKNKIYTIEQFGRLLIPVGSSYSIQNESATENLLLGCVRSPKR